MTKEKVSEILRKHKRWLNNKPGGERANLTNADLTNADLTNADLTDADLRYANLRYVNLTDANLKNADLTNADLTDADLTNANLKNADLTNADLTNANLTNANLDFSALPLWCGSVCVIIDERLAKQFVYHAIVNMPEECKKEFLSDPLAFANGFHQIDKVGKIEW